MCWFSYYQSLCSMLATPKKKSQDRKYDCFHSGVIIYHNKAFMGTWTSRATQFPSWFAGVFHQLQQAKLSQYSRRRLVERKWWNICIYKHMTWSAKWSLTANRILEETSFSKKRVSRWSMNHAIYASQAQKMMGFSVQVVIYIFPMSWPFKHMDQEGQSGYHLTSCFF